MAFVYRSEKKPVYINQSSSEVGPGSYEPVVQKDPELVVQPQRKVPFLSGVDREKKVVEESPGPGAYNIIRPLDGQKVIFQSPENEIKILEVPKPTGTFKSTAPRFQERKDQPEPGPGAYEVVVEQRQPRRATKREHKPHIIEQLMRINKYQSIPSIPGQLHSFGYTENENNELELNKNPNIKYSGGPTDMVGPGTYDVRVPRKRGAVVPWSKDTSKRTQSVNASFSTGPGSYDIEVHGQLHQYKPSAAFTSKTLRSSDQRRGMLQTKFMKDRLKQQSQSFHVSDDKDADETESEYEFIDDATPGPGSYQYASTASTIASNIKTESSFPFGSASERFKEKGVHKPFAVGPGTYQVKYEQKYIIHGQPKPAFLISEPRFDSKAKNVVPGPTYYNPKGSMEEKLISTLQKAPLGSFGVNEERFKDTHLTSHPGPGSYLLNGQPAKPKKIKPTSSFKSQVQRDGLIRKSNSPPPGAYDQVALTIAEACKKEEEDDPELAIQRPAFGVGERRWKETKKIPEEEEEDEPMQRSINDLFRKKPLNAPPFNVRTRRFNYSVDNKPGPGEYHDGIHQQMWNKRTFNIIFAEI